MKGAKRYKFSLILFLFLLFFTSLPVYSTRGCCSWHGGVCGCDTSVGRQICCDGTYSPSCTCAYNPPEVYIPPQPKFPAETQAKWNFYANEDGTWNIKMEVLDSNPTQYSAVISKCAGCDPGPLVDFYSNKFYFPKIAPGKWYVNVKKEINGYWSNIVYWTIDVPEWQKPTSTPIPSYSFTNNDYSDVNKQNNDSNTNFFTSFLRIIGGGGLIYYLVKKIKNAQKP